MSNSNDVNQLDGPNSLYGHLLNAQQLLLGRKTETAATYWQAKVRYLNLLGSGADTVTRTEALDLVEASSLELSRIESSLVEIEDDLVKARNSADRYPSINSPIETDAVPGSGLADQVSGGSAIGSIEQQDLVANEVLNSADANSSLAEDYDAIPYGALDPSAAAGDVDNSAHLASANRGDSAQAGSAKHSAVPSVASIAKPTHGTSRNVVPTSMPELKTGSARSTDDVDRFLRLFERTLYAHGLSLDEHWPRLLPVAVSETVADWLEAYVPLSKPWVEVREALQHNFGNPRAKLAHVRELMLLRIGKRESVANFTTRYQLLAHKAGVGDAD
ncbi:hypothetical protein GGI12_005536, partial [Dipsacomyces acuminosporus]